jgi:hypothetical protein
MTRMHGVGVTLLLIGLATAAPIQTARVRLHAVDLFGNARGPIKVIQFLETRVGGKDYRNLFVGSEAQGIPFGDYIVGVEAGGYRTAVNVSLYSGDTFVVLSGPKVIADYTKGMTPVVRGIVKGLPETPADPVWVRIFSVYQNAGCCWTERVAADGTFSPGHLEAGEYVVLVLHDGGTLYEGRLHLEDPRSEVEVDLPSGVVRATPVSLKDSMRRSAK